MAISARVRVLLVTSLLLGTAPVHADPVTFQERTSGDLPELLPAPGSFMFDVGVNSITGTLAYLPFREFDRDSFAFSVPAGTQVTAITYSFLTTFRPGVVVSQSAFFLGRGNLPVEGVYHLVNVRCCDSAETVSTAFLGALPLGAGIYGLENFGLGFTFLGGTPGEGFSQAYTWSFHVSEASAPVPEPGSLLVIALGLAALAGRRRLTAEVFTHSTLRLSALSRDYRPRQVVGFTARPIRTNRGGIFDPPRRRSTPSSRG